MAQRSGRTQRRTREAAQEAQRPGEELATEPAEEFSIEAQRRGRIHRIAAAGALGPRAGFRLHDEFYRALPTDAMTILIDLRGVTSLNRAAINTLAFMRRRAPTRVRIVPSPAVAAAVRGLAEEARSEETGSGASARGR